MKNEKSLIEKSKEVAKGSKDFKTIKVVTNYKGRVSFYTIQRMPEKANDQHSITCRSGVEVAKSNSLTKENSTTKTYETDVKFEKAIQRIQRIKRKSKPVEIKAFSKKSPTKKAPAKKVVKKEVAQMSVDQIRQRIAESGKMTIKDVVAYFQKWKGQFDEKVVRSNAKEMIAEAKKQNRK